MRQRDSVGDAGRGSWHRRPLQALRIQITTDVGVPIPGLSPLTNPVRIREWNSMQAAAPFKMVRLTAV